MGISQNSSKKLPSGKEATVYLDKDESTVTKIVNYDKYSGTPYDFINYRICLFNRLFPGTGYELVGFTENNNGFAFVVQQPFIKGRLLHNLAFSVSSLVEQQSRVVQFMFDGLGMKPDGLDAYGNGEVVVQDLHLKNVIEGIDGNLYVIDAVPFRIKIDEGKS